MNHSAVALQLVNLPLLLLRRARFFDLATARIYLSFAI
jgi:hypothetical protein